MTEQKKTELMAELERAGTAYLPMQWHNELYKIADSLLTDDLYTKEGAALAIVEVMLDMREEIGRL